MVRTFAIVAVPALALAAEMSPPRIELNLSDLAPGHTAAHGWGYPAVDYTSGTWYAPFSGNSAPKVRECTAKGDTTGTCAAPVCRAWDWQDKHVSKGCAVKYFLINSDNNPKAVPVEHSALNYNLRSEWLIKYNAEDASGNQAREASFTMIMADKEKPADFVLPYSVAPASNFVESALGMKRWNTLDNTLVANDNYDGDVRSTLVLSVTTPDNAKYGYTPVTTTHAYGDIVKLDTLKVGDYKLKYVVHDHAGMYGNSGNDNPAELDAVITVRDTVKPTITINGDSDMTHECATPYTDDFALCHDLRDSYEADGVLSDSKLLATSAGVPVVKGTGANVIDYDCIDAEANTADRKTRKVQVIDTTAPTLDITTVHNDIIDRYCTQDTGCGQHNGLTAEERATQASYDEHFVIQHTAGYAPDMKFIQRLQQDGDGYSCRDTCGTVKEDGSYEPPSTTVTTTWHADSCNGASTTFNEFKPGVYVLKYECEDTHSLKTTKCRTVRNEDKFKPVLTILGRDVMTLEATTTGNYVDDGATCSDATDGEIPASVEVSGDVVKLANIGEYLVQYNCRDAAGNQAEPATRKVIVKQSWGAVTVDTVLAFEYTGFCETKQFAMRVGAAEVAGVDTAAVTATTSEFVGSDQHGKWVVRSGRRLAAGPTCTPTAMETCTQNGNIKVGFTIAVANAAEANRLVAVLSAATFGQQLLDSVNAALLRIHGIKADPPCTNSLPGPIVVEPVGCANSVTCKMNGSAKTQWEASYTYVDPGVACSDELDGVIPAAQVFASSTVDIEKTGTYHVTYEAVNSQGTWNYGFNYDTCAYVRTVNIVDTLKPIMELKYGSEVVKRTTALDISSASGQANKANTQASADIWMAEEATGTSNSWLVAAAGSAVTGLALLALSRKQAAVSVPV